MNKRFIFTLTLCLAFLAHAADGDLGRLEDGT
jgi:hypothetical protein